MKNNKFTILWFLIGVTQCCYMAFIFGKVGGWISFISASSGFATYSLATIRAYSKEGRLLPKPEVVAMILVSE